MRVRTAAPLPLILVFACLRAPGQDNGQISDPLPTGKFITPRGTQTNVGSFPANMIVSPDEKYLIVTNTGYREYLSVLSTKDGHLVSQVQVGDDKERMKSGLYVGLAWTGAGAERELLVSRGSEQKIGRYRLSDDGGLTELPNPVLLPSPVPSGKSNRDIAGIAVGRYLYAANNRTDAYTHLKGELLVCDLQGKLLKTVETPGFPFAVAALDSKVYVSSERDGVVSVVDPEAGRVVRNIPTGDHPMALAFDRSKKRLFVANAGSDTVSVVDTGTDTIRQTVLLRPAGLRGLPGATPTGLALAPDERRLYLTLADMNAVAVVDLPAGRLAGYIPTGWYPTSCAMSPDGYWLFVANAKGVQPRNPNAKDVGSWGRYIENIIEGTVATIAPPRAGELAEMTNAVLVNNHVSPRMLQAARLRPFLNPGIKHVFYIIKENRTYDQVLGDMKQANGDPSVCLFPRDVTPNQHALAERFALLDNFYVCAEVSYDGWSWSTSGMASEYTQRNHPYNYSGRGRQYDSEGDNNGVPVDLLGIRDVAMPPGGYIWDAVARQGLSYRNYGFFLSFVGPGDRGPEGKPLAINNHPNKRALAGHTDLDYLQFDMTYADSDAWRKLVAACPKQMKSYGRHHSPSRFAEWKREFDGFVKRDNLPRFTMIRLPRDHTSGTAEGLHTPRAMVADNDYAVGQIVEAVSRSPYWTSSAIFVLEDDAQNGNDHVDAHRSPCYVISPYIHRGTLDHRFYNTDSTLRTMEALLGLPPMCQYDAVAQPFVFFDGLPNNGEPYNAILPPKHIVGEVNKKSAYRAKESAKLNFRQADAIPDDVLTDIIWHSVKGAAGMPPIRRGFQTAVEKRRDDD